MVSAVLAGREPPMRRWLLLLGTAALAACGAGPPLAVVEVPGDYHDIAACVMAELRATERDMTFADDRAQQRALLWGDYPARGGGAGRKFDIAFAQVNAAQTAV